MTTDLRRRAERFISHFPPSERRERVDDLFTQAERWGLSDELRQALNGDASPQEISNCISTLIRRMNQGMEIIRAGEAKNKNMDQATEKWRCLLNIYTLAYENYLRGPRR